MRVFCNNRYWGSQYRYPRRQSRFLAIRFGQPADMTSTGRKPMSNRLTALGVSLRRSIGAASVIMALWVAGGVAATAQTTTASSTTGSNAFHEPPVFASQNGSLDILMTAKPKPIPTITFTSPTTGKKINPTGWAYEICQRTSSGQTSCPSGSGTVWDYGGTRLALTQGDTLKIHFANQ